jgi:hypothetical protein
MCTIDLNKPEKLTMRSVQKMLASRDDSKHAQIRVSQDGLAYVEHVRWGTDRLEGVLFRTETYAAGNGYVGEEAARDPAWVRKVYELLKELRMAYKDLKTKWLRYGAQRPCELGPPILWDIYGLYAQPNEAG